MLITQIVRTIVPLMWARIVGIVLTSIPALEPLRELLLSQSEVVVVVVTGLLLGAWLAFSAWLQPHLPDWAARVLMGSTKTPTYDAPTTDADTDQTTPEQRQPIPGTTLEGLGE